MWLTLAEWTIYMTVNFFMLLAKVAVYCLALLIRGFLCLLKYPYAMCVICAVGLPTGIWYFGKDTLLHKLIPGNPVAGLVLCVLLLLAITIGTYFLKYANAALCTLCWFPLLWFVYRLLGEYIVEHGFLFVLYNILAVFGIIGFYVYSFSRCQGEIELPFLISSGIAGVFNAITAIIFAVSIKDLICWNNDITTYSIEEEIFGGFACLGYNTPAEKLAFRIILVITGIVVLVLSILVKFLLDRIPQFANEDEQIGCFTNSESL